MSAPILKIPMLDAPQPAEGCNAQQIEAGAEVARSVLEALNRYPHFVVLKGYPAVQERDNLLTLAQAIRAADQTLSQRNQPPRSQPPQQKISFTQVRINPAKVKAKKGVTQYSRTHLPLPPHTDSTYMPRPHELVAFQCIVADAAGGESILIPIEDLLQQLDRETIQQLRSPVYPFGSHSYPVLTGQPGQERLRYYHAQIERAQETGKMPLSEHSLAALEKLDAALQQTERFHRFSLDPGQIVLMHNQKVLHGRTGFAPQSDRLLYRIRLQVDSLAEPSAVPSAIVPKSSHPKPSQAERAHVVEVLSAQGKVLLQRGFFADAAQAFCRCLKIDPTHYESGLILSSLFHFNGDRQAARALLKQVTQQHPYIWKKTPNSEKPSILRIRGLDDSAYSIIRRRNGSYKSMLRGGHFSVRALLEQQSYNLAILNILEDNVDELNDLPKIDLFLNTIACPDLKRTSLLAAARFVDRYPEIPLINHPRSVLKTTREQNAIRLNTIAGVKFAKTERLRWDGQESDRQLKEILGLGFQFPLIVRQVGSQTGKSVALIENRRGLQAHFDSSPMNQDYYVIQFQDCCDATGVFNKIRVFFVDGVLYPVANLFHDAWNVHSGDRYQIMDKAPWTQEKEQSFLQNPTAYLGQTNIDKLYQICDLVNLDFFGIDFTILEDGSLFIFELNAAMRHNFDHAENFSYTKPYLQNISNAFNQMVQNRLRNC